MESGNIGATRIPLEDGDEYDALTSWRHNYRWVPGVRKYIKRKYNRRFRKQNKRAFNLELLEEITNDID